MAPGAIAAFRLGLLLMGVFGAEVSGSLVLTQSGGDASSQPSESSSAASRKLLQGALPNVLCPAGFTVCVFGGRPPFRPGPVVTLCCPGNVPGQCPFRLQNSVGTCVAPITPAPVTPKPAPNPVSCPAGFSVCTFAGQVQLEVGAIPTVQVCCPGTDFPTNVIVVRRTCISPPIATPTPIPSPTPIANTAAGCPIGSLLCPANFPRLGVTLFTCCKLNVCPSSNNQGVLGGPLCTFPPLDTSSP